MKGLAAVGVILGGAWYWNERAKEKKRKKRAKAKAAVPAPPAPEPEPAPAPAPAPSGNKWVGTGWTGWGRKDLFPNVKSIAQALELLGYGGWGTCIQASGSPATYRWMDTNACRARVDTFQRNFNAVMDLLGRNERIGTDGKIGNQTITIGLVKALEVASLGGSSDTFTLACIVAEAWPNDLPDQEWINACAMSWQELVQAAAQA